MAAADKLLVNKRNRELLEPYTVREAAAVDYMRAVNPAAEIVAGPLVDPKVPEEAWAGAAVASLSCPAV